jgi:dipeptidyl aminopeptidase/acylaminoacyl peptidase
VELAKVCGSPDGQHIAVIEGRFHRTVGLGSLTIYDSAGAVALRPLLGAEVSSLAWRDSDRLAFVGFQAPQTVAGTFSLSTRQAQIEWRTSGTAGRKVPSGSPVGHRGFVLPAHAFDRYAHIVRVDDDRRERVVRDFLHDGAKAVLSKLQTASAISWRGRDGLEILGYLAIPPRVERPPLVVFIHGGPSHLFRDSWTFDNSLATLLVNAGYAVLFPNPRGSSGRGLEFASRVMGDMGGEDAHDILLGVDHVIANYPVDGERLFVTGGSYGGYMTSWLVGQTQRFRAACAIAPLTDMRSQFFTAHHPEFLTLYSCGDPYESGGAFDERSPLRHANKVTTPTLVIAGERDKTTPSSQAMQFHRALVLRGVPSTLVLYPEEGHAAMRFEAQIDQGVRVLQWFETHGGRRN